VTTRSTIDLAVVTNEFSLSANVRFLRASFIALFTAFVGFLLAFLVGVYLTRLLDVSNFEGQRGYTTIFVCAPLGIIAGFIIGLVAALRIRRRALEGFLIAQVCSIFITRVVAGLLVGIPYLLSDKPPRIDGTRKIPDQPDGCSIQFSLYTDNRQNRLAFINWNSITRDAEHPTIPGNVSLLTHSKTRSLLASIGNDLGASQFIELTLPPTPRKEDETWSDTERFALRHRIQPVDD